MLSTIQRFSFVLLLTLLFAGCGDDDGNNPSPNNFSRSDMLAFYANSIIQPSFDQLKVDFVEFEATLSTLQNDLNTNTLEAAQNSWLVAFNSWQKANAFNFGPAGEAGLIKDLVEEIGTFPVDQDQLEAFIANDDTTLNNFDRDTRGFLALEYLLFGNEASAEAIVASLSAPTRMSYLLAVSENVSDQVNRVVDDWQGYNSEFIAAAGTDVGSSVSLLYNSFVRSFESIKNFKVGLPAGKRPGQTQAEPQLVEAFYSGSSLVALRTHINTIERLYYGIGLENNGNPAPEGLGFFEYLETVTGGPELIASTEAQWAVVKAALSAVPTDQPLSQSIAENHPSIETLHTELQKHTRFFKSDMSSLLGIAITFSSGDGD